MHLRVQPVKNFYLVALQGLTCNVQFVILI